MVDGNHPEKRQYHPRREPRGLGTPVARRHLPRPDRQRAAKTTFFGLAPMILEKSVQARFLIPMGVSLAFGVLFATMITLVLIPSLYMILEDIKWAWRWTWRTGEYKLPAFAGPDSGRAEHEA